MAYKVASSTECCLLLENALDSLVPKLEEKLNASTSAMKEPSRDKENADPNVQQMDELLRAARLKKKEVQSKNLKRKKTWLDKLCKGKRKATKPSVSTKKGAKVCSNLDMNQKCCHLLINKLVKLLLAATKEKR
jgi:zinc finger SWIM domain-containing protein 3